jgi:predicted protein tyrosine phosphatase
MRRLTPDPTIAVISILDASEARERPDLSGFGEALVMEFVDAYEESQSIPVGAWPDELDEAQQITLCPYRGERLVTLSDALRIVEFANRLHASADDVDLIVHCWGGISRSVAVASWLALALDVPQVHTGAIAYANRRLIRLLDAASGRSIEPRLLERMEIDLAKENAGGLWNT